MTRDFVFWLVAWSPLTLMFAATAWIYRTRNSRPTRKFAWLAACIVTANAAWAAWHCTFLKLEHSLLAPWKDIHVLSLGLLLFTAPIGMVIGIVAAFAGAPKWLVTVLEVASLPLFILGYLAVLEV